MTVLAARLPYWRWWRSTRRRRRQQQRGAVAKPWNGIIAALPLIALLVAADQLTKHVLVSPAGWHVPHDRWLVNTLVILPIFVAFLMWKPTRLAATFELSALIGNTASVVILGAAPNPFLMFPNGSGIAFNLADTYAVVGGVLIVLAIPAMVATRPRRQP